MMIINRVQKTMIETCQKLVATGLTRGTSGNISVRTPKGMMITPSGMSYDTLIPQRLIEMTLEGEALREGQPSSEWRIHADILRTQNEVHAVIHTHPAYCIALAAHHLEIPAFHYMVAIAGGHNIRCADYATFGTQALSLGVLKALKDRKACLMAHHGMIATGKTLEDALVLAIEVEALAKQFWLALQLGPVPCLTQAKMRIALEKFKNYGLSHQISE